MLLYMLKRINFGVNSNPTSSHHPIVDFFFYNSVLLDNSLSAIFK